MSDESNVTKKVSDEVLKQLQELQTAFDRLTKHYGEMTYQKLVIDKELDSALSLMEQLETERARLTTELTQTFGSTGTVNLATGEFVPTS